MNRSPKVRRASFRRASPDLPRCVSEWLLGVAIHCWLAPPPRPSIRFLCVESDFCLLLPPDPASRRRPCSWLAIPTIRACRGLTPLRSAPCLAHKNSVRGRCHANGALSILLRAQRIGWRAICTVIRLVRLPLARQCPPLPRLRARQGRPPIVFVSRHTRAAGNIQPNSGWLCA